MARFLVFAMLCVASASCVKLENLCSSDTFRYKNVLVNAFHVIRLNVTFEPLSHYLIDDSVKCDHFEFNNKTIFWEALKAKHNYNRKFTALYTVNLNIATAKEIMDMRLELASSAWLPLRRMMQTENQVKCLRSFEDTMYSGLSVFTTLTNFFDQHKFPTNDEADYKPTISEGVDILKQIMDELSRTATDGQTFALASDSPLDVYYDRGIVLPRKFEFLTANSNGSIQPDTKSMLTYDLFLPFNNRLHQNAGCVAIKKLPSFYQEKGNEY